MKFVSTPKSGVMRRKLVPSLTGRSRPPSPSGRTGSHGARISIKDAEPARPPAVRPNRPGWGSSAKLTAARGSRVSGKTLLPSHPGSGFHPALRDAWIPRPAGVSPTRVLRVHTGASGSSGTCVRAVKSQTVSAGVPSLRALPVRFQAELAASSPPRHALTPKAPRKFLTATPRRPPESRRGEPSSSEGEGASPQALSLPPS